MKTGGIVLVFSSPSGSGKSTLCRMLIKKFPEIGVSISSTTRLPRLNEVDKKDYFFLSKKQFDNKVLTGDFVEHALVYGNYYGTLRSEVVRLVNSGKVPMFDVDYFGAKQLKKSMSDFHIVSIFILPPSFETVCRRLVLRGQDSIDTISSRMAKFGSDIDRYKYYDYVVVNDDLSVAFSEVCSIYEAAKIKFRTDCDIPSLVGKLHDEISQESFSVSSLSRFIDHGNRKIAV